MSETRRAAREAARRFLNRRRAQQPWQLDSVQLLSVPLSVTATLVVALQVLAEHMPLPCSKQVVQLAERLYVPRRRGVVDAIDAADGSPLWERSVDGTPRGLGASPEHLYLGLRQERPCRGAKTARTTERPVLGALEPAVEDVDGASEVLTGGDGDRRSGERPGTCGAITG